MADTLQTPQEAPPASDRLVAPPAARRFRWLSDGKLAALFISPAMAILLFLSIGPLIWLILLSFTDYSATRDVGYNWIGFGNYTDVLTESTGAGGVTSVVRGAGGTYAAVVA